jgi:predicted transcriptional regulator
MYKSNLSFKQLRLYLNFLLDRGLVEEKLDVDEEARTYTATSKGLEFLRLFQDLQGFLESTVEIRENPSSLPTISVIAK